MVSDIFQGINLKTVLVKIIYRPPLAAVLNVRQQMSLFCQFKTPYACFNGYLLIILPILSYKRVIKIVDSTLLIIITIKSFTHLQSLQKQIQIKF